MPYTIRPLSDRTRFTGKHRPSPFDSGLDATKQLLEYEVGRLNGRDLVLELDVSEGDILISGRALRGHKRPATPGVRVIFTAKGETMTYTTDRFNTWQDNLRAVALAIEALRKIERYGVADSDQQYLGFKALPAGRAMPASHMTSDAARQLVADNVPFTVTADEWADTVERKAVWREARRLAHPDRNNGDRELWDQLEEAGKVLGYIR